MGLLPRTTSAVKWRLCFKGLSSADIRARKSIVSIDDRPEMGKWIHPSVSLHYITHDSISQGHPLCSRADRQTAVQTCRVLLHTPVRQTFTPRRLPTVWGHCLCVCVRACRVCVCVCVCVHVRHMFIHSCTLHPSAFFIVCFLHYN